jgi:hypothetical protein
MRAVIIDERFMTDPDPQSTRVGMCKESCSPAGEILLRAPRIHSRQEQGGTRTLVWILGEAGSGEWNEGIPLLFSVQDASRAGAVDDFEQIPKV